MGSVLTIPLVEFWLLKLDIFRLPYYVHHKGPLSQIPVGIVLPQALTHAEALRL